MCTPTATFEINTHMLYQLFEDKLQIGNENFTPVTPELINLSATPGIFKVTVKNMGNDGLNGVNGSYTIRLNNSIRLLTLNILLDHVSIIVDHKPWAPQLLIPETGSIAYCEGFSTIQSAIPGMNITPFAQSIDLKLNTKYLALEETFVETFRIHFCVAYYSNTTTLPAFRWCYIDPQLKVSQGQH